MSFLGWSFLSAETATARLIKKDESDALFVKEEPVEKAPDEAKDETDVRSPEGEQENRAPADDHFNALMKEKDEDAVEMKLEDVKVVDATPADVMEQFNPNSPRGLPLECDYDVDPTQLYLSLQQRNWDDAIERCKDHEKEARTWVSRKETNGKLRWRLLPLHAAVIFKAPDYVIEALLAAYPRGAESKDDQGMLPLHLSFRNGSSESVVNLLLAAFPKSVEVKDRKGRIPLALAQASTSPNRDSFLRSLERGPSYYASAAAATERAAVTAEQQAIFDVKLREIEEAHRQEVEMLRVDAEQKQEDLQDKIAAMEKDLEKTRETSQVLVEHVNTLEAQLNSRTDTERFLATRIAALDVDLKETAKSKEELESTLMKENEELKVQNKILEDELNALKEAHTYHAEKLRSTEADLAKTQETKEENLKELHDTLATIQKEWACAKASEAVLEAQLKKRIKSEKALAAEVSFLASRLAESAHQSGKSVDSYSTRVRSLEKERDELRLTVKVLTEKLSSVALALDDMMVGQQRIVDAATEQEASLAEAADIQSKIIVHAKRHQDLFEAAQKERQELARAIKRQEEEAAKQAEERMAILEAFELQAEQMEDAKKERRQLINGVQKQRRDIQNLILNSLSGIGPALTTAKDDELVDEVVKMVLSHDTVDVVISTNAEETVKAESTCDLEEPLKPTHEQRGVESGKEATGRKKAEELTEEAEEEAVVETAEEQARANESTPTDDEIESMPNAL
jgi:hypothetical protein